LKRIVAKIDGAVHLGAFLLAVPFPLQRNSFQYARCRW